MRGKVEAELQFGERVPVSEHSIVLKKSGKGGMSHRPLWDE
jgi:hypothetical protein